MIIKIIIGYSLLLCSLSVIILVFPIKSKQSQVIGTVVVLGKSYDLHGCL